MSDRISTRADDRAWTTEQFDRNQSLVSLSDMQLFQARATRGGPVRTESIIDQSGGIDFGSLDALYTAAPQEIRTNGATRINAPQELRISSTGEIGANSPAELGASTPADRQIQGRTPPPESIRETAAPIPVTDEDLAARRTALTNEISRMPRQMARDITESMRVLENRTPPLSNEQIAGVYEATQRLLQDRNRTSPLTLAQRQLLATGILDNAARPSEIDQGRHETCNVTVLEERLNTLNPARAAAIVAEVGLTGSFTSTPGFRPTLDRTSLLPDSEARVLPSNGDGLRNYASQIFDVAVLNDFYQRGNPNVRYVQRDMRAMANPDAMAPTGEGIVISDNDRVSPAAARAARRFIGMNLPRINRMGESLGLGENYIIGHSRAGDAHAADGTTVVSNVRELAQALERARATNNFPIVLGVEADGPMFRNRNMRGAHVLSVTGYNPETQTVQISNQWGRQQDLQNVPLQDLHDSMFTNKPRR
ncbi:MAG: hypothetical protein U0103_09320 [Candidatus Obscuribacterales bacterium]